MENKQLTQREILLSELEIAKKNYSDSWADIGGHKAKAVAEAERNLFEYNTKHPSALQVGADLLCVLSGAGGGAEIGYAIKNVSLGAATGVANLVIGGADLATKGVVGSLNLGASAVSSSVGAIGGGIKAGANLMSGLFSKKSALPKDSEKPELKKTNFEIIYEKGADTLAGDHITFKLEEDSPRWCATKTNPGSAANLSVYMSLEAFKNLCLGADCSKEMPILGQDPFEPVLAGAGSEEAAE